MSLFSRISNILGRFVEPSPCFYGLEGLDQKLAKHVTGRAGFFVEAGANDGLQQSNTLYFEKHRNWRGLLIEPDPTLAEKCRLARPSSVTVQAALVSPEDAGNNISLVSQGLMGFVRGAFKSPEEEIEHLQNGQKMGQPESKVVSVPGQTLSQILDMHGIKRIDMLCLDVEGFEGPALRGLDFSRHQPEFILVEARYPDDIWLVLGNHYNRIDCLTERDWLFRRKK